MMEVLAPCIVYGMPADEYHGDPCPEPALSASMAQILLSQSPMHAWHAHPRLNPDFEEKPSTPEQDEGTALHSLILENSSIVTCIDAKNYTLAATRALRDDIRKAGRIPVLKERFEELLKVAPAMRAQIAAHKNCADAFTDGEPEASLFWQQGTRFGTIWCKTRVDWLPNRPNWWIDDLKTVAQSAEPMTWQKSLLDHGAPLQHAFNVQGNLMLRGGAQSKGVRFAGIERKAPHGLSMIALGPELVAIGEERMRVACELWAMCLRDNVWAGYPPYLTRLEAPGFFVMKWDEKKTREHAVRSLEVDPRVANSPSPWA